MRNPERTKKTSTPKKPPPAQANPPWKTRTSTMAEGPDAVEGRDATERGLRSRGVPDVTVVVGWVRTGRDPLLHGSSHRRIVAPDLRRPDVGAGPFSWPSGRRRTVGASASAVAR